MRERPLLILATTLAAASSALARDTLHLRTSRDSFLHEQFTSKAEFIEALREHPAILSDMAACVHQTPDYLLEYIRTSVHLGRLQSEGRYENWGRADGRVIKGWRTFKAGTPVWEASDGTPIFRWLCGNPMTESLPPEAVAQTPPPPEAPAPPPPPAPAVEPPPAPTPPPPPPPAEPPAPTPPPPPPVQPAPPPPPVPQATEQPPAPQMLEIPITENRPTRIEGGDLQWTAHRNRSDGILTAGISEDFARVWRSGHLGIYGDVAGIMQRDPPFRYYGGGLVYRQSFGARGQAIRPYAGLGVGFYHLAIHDWTDQSVDRVGEKLFVGLDTPSGIFVEVAASTFGKTDQRQLNTLGVSLGFRF